MPAVKQYKNSSKIAVASICAALCTVVMILTGALSVASLAGPAVAGCFIIPVVVICGLKYAYTVYAVVALLSFLLVPDREAMLIYILFFGYYPILFATLSKIKNVILQYVVKLLILNIAAVLDYLIITFIFMIPTEAFQLMGVDILYLALILANVVFIVYDFSLKNLITLYMIKFHPMITKIILK